MTRVLEKVERRIGEKLFIKGDRCLGPKCAVVRRPFPPGVHGNSKKRGRRTGSEFGTLLREKQKIHFIYGFDEKDIRRYSREATEKRGVFALNFLRLVELRLDNVVYRLGIASSRRAARQFVGHKHITVNERIVSIPSFRVKKGDVIGIVGRSVSSPLFTELKERLKKHTTPEWILLDPEDMKGTVSRLPEAADNDISVDVTKIKEFYSR